MYKRAFINHLDLLKSAGYFLAASIATLAFSTTILAHDYSSAAELGLMEGFPPPRQ